MPRTRHPGAHVLRLPGNAITTNALPILRACGIQFARRGGAPEHPYEGGRGVAYELGLDHPLLIPTAGDARPDWTLADFVGAVEKARDGRIAVVQFHGVPDRAHPWVNTPPEKFEAYLDYLAGNQYRVAGSTAFQQMFTRKSATYGVSVTDYHSTVHGRAAPYLKAIVVGDLAEIIRDRQPKEIYVTHEAGTHGDHRAAFWLVRDAILAANYQGDFFTYVVHGAPPPQPASRRVTLTKTQVDTKRAALQNHQAGTSPVHDQLAAEYTKPEELFWKVRVAPATAK